MSSIHFIVPGIRYLRFPRDEIRLITCDGSRIVIQLTTIREPVFLENVDSKYLDQLMRDLTIHEIDIDVTWLAKLDAHGTVEEWKRTESRPNYYS